MAADNYKKSWTRTLAAYLGIAFALLATPLTARAIPIDLNVFYADPSVAVAADGSAAQLREDANRNPVFLSSFNYGTATVDPAALFSVTDTGQQFSFSFDFTEPAGNDDQFFLNLLDDAGALLLPLFITDAASAGLVTVNLDSFVGQAIGIEFGIESFDTILGSVVEISSLDVTADRFIKISEPATVALLLPWLLALLRLRARRR